MKDKNNIFIKQNIAFLFQTKIYFIIGDILFEIPKNLIVLAFFFFFAEADTKNMDMPRQKPRMLPGKTYWLNC